MSQVTGALALIRERVQQQQINEIERKARRKQAEECLARALSKQAALMREFEQAQVAWPLTDREQRMWQKKMATATEVLLAARNRLERLP